MNKHHSVIVLNGHRYNAHTGESLTHPGKTVAARHTPPARPKAVHPSAPKKSASRHAGHHVKPHAPKPARTLMRQAVKKPAVSAKRRIRVQSQLGHHLQPVAITHHSPTPRRASKATTGRLINHFSPSLFIVTETALSTAAKKPVKQTAVQVHVAPRQHTTSELLEYAVQYADVPQAMDWPVSRKQHRRPLRRRQAHAIGAHA